MNLKNFFIIMFLSIALLIVGCYTKLGYYESNSLKEKQLKQVEANKQKMGDTAEADAETEGYYGKRKRSYIPTYSNTDVGYWTPYVAYPYAYFPSIYYPHPWYYGYGYYGYHAPYYRYYRSYYPYTGYHRWSGRSAYPYGYRNTYNKGTVSKTSRYNNRRAHYSRSVTTSNPRSSRPLQRSNNRNED